MKITVEISEDGTSVIDVDGIKGPQCTEYTKAIIQALGGDVLSDEKKPEYHQQETKTVTAGA